MLELITVLKDIIQKETVTAIYAWAPA